MINLLDLPLSERVRQRAKMFIDIAMVEAEQFAINGVQGGQKNRSKKDDLSHLSGLHGTMYGSIARMLYEHVLLSTKDLLKFARCPMLYSLCPHQTDCTRGL